MDTNLSVSGASFQGEEEGDWAGRSVAGAGDVNGDGYDDILIGAWGNDDGGNKAGQTYLILGKGSGWAMDTVLSASDASFRGEHTDDWSGISVAGGGDINGDGYDDILIGAYENDEGGNGAGQTYLIFPDHNSGPTSVTSIKAYYDEECTHETSNAYPGSKIYLELQGIDGDGRKNIAEVWIKGSSNPEKRFRVRLLETGENTGRYRGNITIANRTHSGYGWINASPGGWVEISSRKNASRSINLSIGLGLHIEPRPTDVYVNEDDSYLLHFNTTGVDPESWTFDTNAPWLSWDEINKNLTGTPTNLDVGTYWVDLYVEGNAFSDEIYFTVVVNNTPPEISLPGKHNIYEDEELIMDIDSTDEGEGITKWNLETDANWLSQNSTTGILYGTPSNLDVGIYNVNVSIDDGNGGNDFLEFFFEVLNTPPEINSHNVQEISQNENYYIDYNSTDDGQGNIAWYLSTNATWLSIDTSTGVLNGTPSNDDVGTYHVNVSVSDGNGGWDHTSFLLRVGNINDPPILFKGNCSPSNGTTTTDFTFSIVYKDIDGDEPVNISLVLDGHWYAMKNNGSLPLDHQEGMRYYSTLKLSEGVHRYHFYASDGNANIRFPSDGDFSTSHIRYRPSNGSDNDTDNDTIIETDSDNDGYNDTYENESGSDPYDPRSTPLDWDGDGVPNEEDAYPRDASRWERESSFPYRILLVLGVLVIITILIIVCYSRIKAGKVLEQGGRQEIYSFIRDNPGEHYRAIKRKLGVSRGMLSHHLRKLEETGMIRSRRVSYYKLFYPAGSDLGKRPLTPGQKKIVSIIRRANGISTREIARRMNKKPQTVRYHLAEMADRGLVSVEKNENYAVWVISDRTEESG